MEITSLPTEDPLAVSDSNHLVFPSSQNKLNLEFATFFFGFLRLPLVVVVSYIAFHETRFKTTKMSTATFTIHIILEINIQRNVEEIIYT